MTLVITKHLKSYLETFTTEEFHAIIGALNKYTPNKARIY